jgi:hypothetical protein
MTTTDFMQHIVVCQCLLFYSLVVFFQHFLIMETYTIHKYDKPKLGVIYYGDPKLWKRKKRSQDVNPNKHIVNVLV